MSRLSRLSETADSDGWRWVHPHVIKIYCPQDLNVSCVRSGCITFGNVIVTNRNPGRRATVEVVSPLCEEDSHLWVPSKNFELAVSESREISLGMFVTPHADVIRKRCLQFEIRFGPSKRIRERYPHLSTLHAEVVNFTLVPADNGTSPVIIVHSCFRNHKHDRICRVQCLEASERHRSNEEEGEERNESSSEGSVELIEPDLGDAAEEQRRILDASTGEIEQRTDHIPNPATEETLRTPYRVTAGMGTLAAILFEYRRWSLLILTILLSVALYSFYSNLILGFATIRLKNGLLMAYVRIVTFFCRLCHMQMNRLMQHQRPGIDYIPSKALVSIPRR